MAKVIFTNLTQLKVNLFLLLETQFRTLKTINTFTFPCIYYPEPSLKFYISYHHARFTWVLATCKKDVTLITKWYILHIIWYSWVWKSRRKSDLVYSRKTTAGNQGENKKGLSGISCELSPVVHLSWASRGFLLVLRFLSLTKTHLSSMGPQYLAHAVVLTLSLWRSLIKNKNLVANVI